MEINKFSINKKDFLCIAIILLISIVFFFLAYARFGMFFIDTSREVYIPMIMNKGAVLYKDIFNVYSPFGYQLNSLLYLIMGENLNTLYIAGFVNCIFFNFGFFAICKLFFKDLIFISLCMTLFVISGFSFSVSLDNHIFPYSYSMVYAMSSFTWSLYFLLKYIKYNKYNNLVFSFLFFGLCISFKYEYLLFSLILFYIPFFKSLPLKKIVLLFFVFALIPSLSLTILLIQGCRLIDFYNAINYMWALSKSKSVRYCYKIMGMLPSFDLLKLLLKNFIITNCFLFIYNYIFYYSLVKIRKVLSYSFILLLFSFTIYILYPYFVVNNSEFFNWIGIFDIFILIILLVKRKKLYDNFYSLFLILSMSSILVSLKSILNVMSCNYGNFFFPFLFLVFTFFFIHYFPMLFNNKIKLCEYKITISLLLLLGIVLFTSSNIQRRSYSFNSQIRTKKGIIYVSQDKAKAINEILTYIKTQTRETDQVLVLCEGAMINFLSDRKSNNKYYYLIPPNIEIFGEDNIVKDLEKDLPDYIVIQPMSYINFKETFFCESFGLKICNIIPKYYKKPIVFGKDFWIAIYERKNNDKE